MTRKDTSIDMGEIKKIVECDADIETKYNMIYNILTAKPHYFEKQEPCEDWHDVPSDEMTLEQSRQAIKDLRKKLAECLEQAPALKWIPVKERLPETDGEYLLFGKVDEFDEGYYKFIGTFDAGAEEFGIWQECFDYNTLGCIGSEFYEYDEVLAWMTLPDDYKEEVEE